VCGVDAGKLGHGGVVRERRDGVGGAAGGIPAMSVIVILILASLAVALAFLAAFVWAVRAGQFDDTATPALRVLAEERPAADSARGSQATVSPGLSPNGPQPPRAASDAAGWPAGPGAAHVAAAGAAEPEGASLKSRAGDVAVLRPTGAEISQNL
jgi:cbb3-type cytochrome oxidase maturation protein